MALRDWKKVNVSKENYTIFGWQNTEDKENHILIDSYPLGMYEVIFVIKNKDGTKDGNTLKQTKTKSAALKFAKSYMRKH